MKIKNKNNFLSESKNTLRFNIDLNTIPSILSVGYLRNFNLFNIESKVGILYIPIENVYGKLKEDIGFDNLLDLIDKLQNLETYKTTIESIGDIVNNIDLDNYSSIIGTLDDLNLNDLLNIDVNIDGITYNNYQEKINNLQNTINDFNDNLDSIINTSENLISEFNEAQIDFTNFQTNINDKIIEINGIIDDFTDDFKGVLDFVSSFKSKEDLVRYFLNFDRRSIGFINITKLPQFEIFKSLKFDNEICVSTYNNYLVGRILEVKIINYLKLISKFKNNFNLSLTINNSAVYIKTPVDKENTFYSNNFSYYPAFGVDISLFKTFLLSAKYVITNRKIAIEELDSNISNISNIELNFSLLF